MTVSDGYYITSFCDSGNATQAVIGSNLQTSKCSTPASNQYVVSPCIKINATVGNGYATVGRDTVIKNCSIPSNSYFTSICLTGDINTVGKGPTFSLCSQPSATQFVQSSCIVGSYNQIGNNSITSDCITVINDGYYFKERCNQGNIFSQGSNAKISKCSLPTTSQTSCSSTEYLNYVTSLCVKGSYDIIGQDSLLKTCTLPQTGKIVYASCIGGSYDILGSDTVQSEKLCPFSTIGSSVTGNFSCVCDKSYYQSSLNTKCVTCQDGMLCDENNILYSNVEVLDGYYKVVNNDFQLVAALECPPNACNYNSSSNSVCREGYRGYLCSNCDEGYYDSNSLRDATKCEVCPSSKAGELVVIFGIMGAVAVGCLIISFLVYLKLNRNLNVDKKKKVKKVTSVLQRLVLSHLQILSIIGQFSKKNIYIYIYYNTNDDL